MSSAIISSPLGNLLIEVTDGAVKTIQFTEEARSENSENELGNISSKLRDYFEGKRRLFNFPLEPQGSVFQKKVWQELQKIPYGETISYQELANRLGDPKCIRAAAAANGKNPIAIVIPCHRVIGSDGSMTGYAGGLERKKALLRLEGAEIMNQINLFQ